MEIKPKQIIFGQQVRDKIVKGVAIVERAVGTTLGSKGRNVSLQMNWGESKIIHDGVSVAREIILSDPFENEAAQHVINAAKNTNDEAGDGTTTATILTNSIVKEGMQVISSGINPMIVNKGIAFAVAKVVEELKTIAKPVKSYDEMVQVATVSAADAEMGKIIATAIQKVGEHGVVTVQEGQTSSIEVEYKEGMDFQKGYISPYMMTNEKFESVLEKRKADEGIYIILVNETLTNENLVTLYKLILATDNKPQVVIIADSFDQDAFATMVLNRVKNKLPMIGVYSPEYGDHRTNILSDIAVLTGGTVLGGAGIAIKDAKLENIGRADKVIASQTSTLIIGGKGDKQALAERVATLDSFIAESKDPFQKDKLEARKAKLVGGVAVINVGAPSEVEMRDKKERVYDAVNATQAAIAEGIVPGGGVALLRAAKYLDNIKVSDEQKIGTDIIKRAIQYPLLRLAENVGVINPGIILGKILESDDDDFGYNVDQETYGNMIAMGIIDPVKVTRSALQNAASIAQMLLTTDCMIVNMPEQKVLREADREGIGRFTD